MSRFSIPRFGGLRRALSAASALLLAPAARAQAAMNDFTGDFVDMDQVGWSGFADVDFMLHAFLALSLASALAALLAFHPRIRSSVDTVDEAEAPKVAVTYAVLGAIIGIMVVRYGLVIGFVVFGIGGLFRFRTALASTSGTGQLILVTLVGLAVGLDLPHLGVLATAFGYLLTYLLSSVVTHQIRIDSLGRSHLTESSHTYRALIEASGAKVIREERLPDKHRVRFIVRASHRFDREAMERTLETEVPEKLRGTVDWAVE